MFKTDARDGVCLSERYKIAGAFSLSSVIVMDTLIFPKDLTGHLGTIVRRKGQVAYVKVGSYRSLFRAKSESGHLLCNGDEVEVVGSCLHTDVIVKVVSSVPL